MTRVNRSGRLVIYSIDPTRSHVDAHVEHALAALRPLSLRLIVIGPEGLPGMEQERLANQVDDLVLVSDSAFQSSVYLRALEQAGVEASSFDEVVFTGDGWFGPVADLADVVQRMQDSAIDVWQMVENRHDIPEVDFAEEGFVSRPGPWIWTSVPGDLVSDRRWHEAWASAGDDDGAFEPRLGRALAARGISTGFAYSAAAFSGGDPLLWDSLTLIDAGCPIVGRRQFEMFPAVLNQRAVIGRDTLDRIAATGFPVELILQSLVRSVPPRALSANLGLLEVLSDTPSTADGDPGFKILAVVHVSDASALHNVLDGLTNVPSGYDLLVTAGDGMLASQLQRVIEARGDIGYARLEMRVVPPTKGRDMSDFFVGCRDVLLQGGYDLVFKLHARRFSKKTMNVQRYFRRYQLDNLLNSPGYVANLVDLFRREPGLGMVFPPMVHIGYGTMGRGWAGLRGPVGKLLSELGVHVPVDSGSPIAPFGGMWVARPAALRRILFRSWKHHDYIRSTRARELAHTQERALVLAAAEDGFHARAVLTAEHASISHTALEYKVDAVSTTIRGYPIDQVRFLRRMGSMGYGGQTAVARMYVSFHLPSAARVLTPVYDSVLRSRELAKSGLRAIARVRRNLAEEEVRYR